MNRVHAIVVGVSRYAVAGWSLSGPARNAGMIASMLLRMGLAPSRLHLFTTQEDMADEDIALIAARDVSCRPTTAEAIDTFWRTELATDAADGDALLFFWSGHGMTDLAEQRIFFCSDYRIDLPSRVFNASGFSRHLKAVPYSRFRDQLLLADACGSYASAPVVPATDAPQRMQGARQLAIWASPDGAYAREEDGTGIFTGAATEVLSELGLNPWPDQQRFVDAIEVRTADWDFAPTVLRWTGTSGSDQRRLGTDDERAALTRSLLALLGTHPIAEAVTRRAFTHTIRHLGVIARPSGSLPDAIAVLADLDDSWNQGAPFALTQFLMRIAADLDLAVAARGPLAQWTMQHSIVYVRNHVQEVLDAERQTMLLLVEVDTDSVSGALSGLTANLRYPDLSPVPGFGTRRRSAHDKATLDAGLCGFIETDIAEFAPQELEVHLILDPPAFAWPFHQAALVGGNALGEDHVCIAHYRRRAKARTGALVDQWRNWANALPDPIDFNTLLALPAAPNALPATQGIFYVDAALDAAATDPAAWKQLDRLLRLGAPYLCWPIVDPSGAPVFPDALRALIGPVESFEHIPARIHFERLRGCPDARRISVLWDPPAFRPYDYQNLQGVA